MTEEIRLIAARRQVIERLRGEYRAALTVLDDESAELDMAENVIARLIRDKDSDLFGGPPALPIGLRPNLEPAPAPAPQSGKPDGTPTMPEMIIQILELRKRHGLPGATVKQFANDIAIEWWPTVTTTEINPIAWRMAKRGQIVKNGTLYSLPTTDANGIAIITPPSGEEPPEDEA